MVWRHPDAVLNELEPLVSEMDEGLLKALRVVLLDFVLSLNIFLVSNGVSVLWDKPNRDPMFMRGDQGMLFRFPLSTFLHSYVFQHFCSFAIVMSALDFIKPDDTSDIVLGDVETIDREDAITRTAEGRLVPGGKYVSVPNVKGFTKVSSSKPSTCRSSHRLKGPSQSTATDHVDLSDDIEVSDDPGVEVDVKKDKD
ncbi:hypothetical protein Hdeb2414_s0015g00448821 [Helianthus debilis subsp. tardiflorus]